MPDAATNVVHRHNAYHRDGTSKNRIKGMGHLNPKKESENARLFLHSIEIYSRTQQRETRAPTHSRTDIEMMHKYKRTRARCTSHEPPAKRRCCRPSPTPLPPPPTACAHTRLAYLTCTPLTHAPLPLLRPTAKLCTTWAEAEAAFDRLGHGGSVVAKTADGETRFVGTRPVLRAWWEAHGHRTSATTTASAHYPSPVALEENLWSRHPRTHVDCFRYRYDVSDGTSALDQLTTARRPYSVTSTTTSPTPSSSTPSCTPTRSRIITPSLDYVWVATSTSPTLRAIANTSRAFVEANRSHLPLAGALDLCWFAAPRQLYVVDSVPAAHRRPYPDRT